MKKKLIRIFYYFVVFVFSFDSADRFLQRKRGMYVSFIHGHFVPEFIGTLIGFVGMMVLFSWIVGKIQNGIGLPEKRNFPLTLLIFTLLFAAIIFFAPDFFF